MPTQHAACWELFPAGYRAEVGGLSAWARVVVGQCVNCDSDYDTCVTTDALTRRRVSVCVMRMRSAIRPSGAVACACACSSVW